MKMQDPSKVNKNNWGSLASPNNQTSQKVNYYPEAFNSWSNKLKSHKNHGSTDVDTLSVKKGNSNY